MTGLAALNAEIARTFAGCAVRDLSRQCQLTFRDAARSRFLPRELAMLRKAPPILGPTSLIGPERAGSAVAGPARPGTPRR